MKVFQMSIYLPQLICMPRPLLAKGPAHSSTFQGPVCTFSLTGSGRDGNEQNDAEVNVTKGSPRSSDTI